MLYIITMKRVEGLPINDTPCEDLLPDGDRLHFVVQYVMNPTLIHLHGKFDYQILVRNVGVGNPMLKKTPLLLFTSNEGNSLNDNSVGKIVSSLTRLITLTAPNMWYQFERTHSPGTDMREVRNWSCLFTKFSRMNTVNLQDLETRYDAYIAALKTPREQQPCIGDTDESHHETAEEVQPTPNFMPPPPIPADPYSADPYSADSYSADPYTADPASAPPPAKKQKQLQSTPVDTLDGYGGVGHDAATTSGMSIMDFLNANESFDGNDFDDL